MAFAFFPIVTRQLSNQPKAVERLTRGYLAILAICDVSRILTQMHTDIIDPTVCSLMLYDHTG
jgi:hypothetical protein